MSLKPVLRAMEWDGDVVVIVPDAMETSCARAGGPELNAAVAIAARLQACVGAKGRYAGVGAAASRSPPRPVSLRARARGGACGAGAQRCRVASERCGANI